MARVFPVLEWLHRILFFVVISQVNGHFALLGDRQTQLSFIDGVLGYRNRAVYAFTIEGTIPPFFCFSIRLHGTLRTG